MASRLIAAKVLQDMYPRTPELRLPRRRNCSRQGALACGFTTVWYIEEELIANFIDAGYGCRGWMSESFVRKELHNLSSNMLACEQRMCHEEQHMQEKLHALILVKSDIEHKGRIGAFSGHIVCLLKCLPVEDSQMSHVVLQSIHVGCRVLVNHIEQRLIFLFLSTRMDRCILLQRVCCVVLLSCFGLA